MIKTGKKALFQELEKKGAMTIEEYMGFCLYHPEFGYYQRTDGILKGLGQENFTTAPEVSPLFGEMIALDFLNHYQQNPLLHDSSTIHLIEFGPGRGTLILDILKTFRMIPEIIPKLRLHLIETSPVLKAMQKDRLKDYAEILSFPKSIADIPTDGIWYFCANEFFDALPYRQFLPNGEERKIIKGGDNLNFADQTAAKHIKETSPEGHLFMNHIAKSMNKAKAGMGVIIDYGYFGESKGDTFQALYKGRKIHPLAFPTEADLTFQVGFDSLCEIIKSYGFKTKTITQADYLMSMGIETRFQMLMSAYEAKGQAIKAKALKEGLLRLIGATQMGQLFKVLRFES